MEAEVDDLDPQVIAAARRGDVRAFEVIVRRYQHPIWRLCFHLTGERVSAEDATQEAFLKIYRYLPRYRMQSRFSTWLFAIARNCAIDELRRRARRDMLGRRASREDDIEKDPSEVFEVRQALASLPLELREPLVWIDVLGTSYAEAADMLRIPIGTLKSRIHRARHVLALELLDEEGDAGEA
ncbi:MAG: sigma-70 family RNA polymerase sigma factor [Actinobacteria bacterium]|nr:sigma-70 family RNA polymerase sigma factor [Actinomycetota bacterium]